MSKLSSAGKGDVCRPVDKAKYDRNYERIFWASESTANDIARQVAAKLMLSFRHLTDRGRLAVFDILRQNQRYRLAAFNLLRRQYCLRCGAKRPEETCGCFNKEK